jgi:hypothetical protein
MLLASTLANYFNTRVREIGYQYFSQQRVRTLRSHLQTLDPAPRQIYTGSNPSNAGTNPLVNSLAYFLQNLLREPLVIDGTSENERSDEG